MIPKDGFKVFDEVKEKKTKTFEKEEGIAHLNGPMDTIHIPGEAYKDLYNMPQYAYLENGLYIGTEIMSVNDVHNDAYVNNIRLNMPFTGNITKLSWCGAMKYAKEKEGKLLTLSEYLYTLDHLDGLEEELYEQMRYRSTEYLDGILSLKLNCGMVTNIKCELSDHNDSDGMSPKQGITKDAPGYMNTMNWPGIYLDLATKDPELGVPKDFEYTMHNDTLFKINNSFNNELDEGLRALIRGTAPIPTGQLNINSMKKTSTMIRYQDDPKLKYQNIGLRLCYKVRK